jgi:hypothetical protein
MHKRILSGVALLALAACSLGEEGAGALADDAREPVADASEADVDKGEADTSSDNPDKAEKESAIAKAEAMDFTDNEKNGVAEREFSYAWPAAASAEPKLFRKLLGMRNMALAEQKREWRAAVDEFGTNDCVTCVGRDHSASWEVAANIPRFLSLSGGTYFYTGGAHGNSTFDSIVWDREAEQARKVTDLFRSERALWRVASRAYCPALDREREKRRGRPVQSEDFGSDCPPLSELVLVLGTSNGNVFDRLDVLAAPYVAGAYAEGPYEVSIPVTQRILEAVKPDYRAYFAGRE